MKFLLVVLMVSFQSRAVTLGKYKSEEDGSVNQTFDVEKGKALYSKGSNLFDLEKNDLRVGQFSAKDPSKFDAIFNKLSELEKRFKVVDDELKKRKKSFNDISGPPGHRTILVLGEYRVMPESKYFGELDLLYKELQKQDWDFKEGYELSTDLSRVTVVKEGKISKTESYNKDFYCRDSSLSCTYIGGGLIFVRSTK